ncbi:MAG: hypothetical protein RLZ98_2731 [Pseudomonadota bacterium]|jgi:cysteinyl-tRNA synthetase
MVGFGRAWRGVAGLTSRVAVLLLATVHGVLADEMAEIQSARAEQRAALNAVARWGCQYMNIDLEKLAQSPLDLVVIEPIVDPAAGRAATRGEIAKLKRRPDGRRRIVLAYLSVGAAEEYRSYWRAEWKKGAAPGWLGTENPEWPRSYAVRYWHDEWRALLTGAILRLVEAGYDGAFLDKVDGFHDWHGKRPTAMADMVRLIEAIAGAARKQQPGFILVGQNAEQLIANPAYLATIDAISKESLLYGLHGPGVMNRQEDRAWSLNYLRSAKQFGLPVFTIEYIDDAAAREYAATQHKSMSFTPFFGSRLLDVQP